MENSKGRIIQTIRSRRFLQNLTITAAQSSKGSSSTGRFIMRMCLWRATSVSETQGVKVKCVQTSSNCPYIQNRKSDCQGKRPAEAGGQQTILQKRGVWQNIFLPQCIFSTQKEYFSEFNRNIAFITAKDDICNPFAWMKICKFAFLVEREDGKIRKTLNDICR